MNDFSALHHLLLLLIRPFVRKSESRGDGGLMCCTSDFQAGDCNSVELYNNCYVKFTVTPHTGQASISAPPSYTAVVS